MSFQPKVSIVIPVYNGENYVRKAIDSALAQSYKNTEVIVVNDGSSDGGKTEEIAISYGDKIRYYRKENGGVASALNFGIRAMVGEYFSWLSHDDIYYPHKLEKQIGYLKGNEKNVILYSDYDIIDEKSRFIGSEKNSHINKENIFYDLMTKWPVHGCTTLIPKHFFDRIGLFDERLKTTQDYDMWFRMSEKFKFVHLDEVLIASRVHPNQGTRSMQDVVQKECNELYSNALKNYSLKARQNVPEGSASLWYARISLALKKKGYAGAAYVALKESLVWWLKSDIASAIKTILLISFCLTYRPLLSIKYSLRKLKRSHENTCYS